MSKLTINAMIEGGKASPAPPLGPSLAPTGLNVAQVIAALNEKTKAFSGMQVPVKVIVDKEKKSYEIEVGTPPTSALIKGELGIKENVKEEAGVKGKKVIGDITVDQMKRIAAMKDNTSLSKTEDALLNEIAGTCLSMGVTIEGKNPKDWIKAHGASKPKKKWNSFLFSFFPRKNLNIPLR